jgi:hypothetical protein
MTMRKILALLFSLWACETQAQTIIGTLPFTLQNGTIADANQVMADFNTIIASVNANAANSGANSNITALNGLTTPLVYTSGGTSSYIGGTSSGSANAQVVASPIPGGFNLITGKSIIFVAGFTNNGPTTLNVNATGVTNVFKQTASGAIAMAGGEIVAGQLYTATFDGTEYQIQGPSPQSSVLPCTSIDWNGATAPSGYLLLNGQAVSRTTFVALFGCITVQGVAATTASGSASVVVPNSALFQIGWSVGGNNVTCNSTISAIPDGTHITISNNAGANGATTLTIGPYGQGDCSTTFNVGNFLGRTTVMRDTGGSILTATTCTNPASIGTSCGTQIKTIAQGNLPSYNLPVADPGHTHGFTVFNTTAGAGAGSATVGSLGTAVTNSATTGIVVSSGGSNVPLSSIAPIALVDKYIKF